MALTTINSDGVKDDSIINADIKSDAAISGSKISPDFGSQDITISDNIIHSGDTNTKIRFPAADTFSVEAGGLEKLRIEGDYAGTVDVKGSPAHLRLNSSRDTSDWDATDPIGKLDYYVGVDTTNNLPYNAGFIHCLNETENADEPSGALVFGTSTANNSGGAIERVRIASSGQLLLGTTTEGSEYADNLTIEDSTHCGITLRSGTTSDGSIFFSDATSGASEYDGYIQYGQNGRHLTFGTATLPRVRIDSDGKVGIANTSPDKSLTIGGTVPVIKTNDGSGRTLELRGGSTSHNPGLVTTYASNLYLGSNGTESVNIGTEHLTIADGDLVIGTSGHGIRANGPNNSTYGELKIQVDVPDGSGSNNEATFKKASSGIVLAFPSGGGIDFSATGTAPNKSSGTTPAHILDEYETGEWTPAWTSGVTASSYTEQTGFYTRIGNRVEATCYIRTAAGSTTAAAAADIGGLPYTSSNVSRSESGGYIIYQDGYMGSVSDANVWITQNNTIIRFHDKDDGGVILGNELVPGNKYIILQVNYMAA